MNRNVIFITGVSGSGKTTLGRLLAQRLDIPFADGDDFHPPENIHKMQSGVPLNDADRLPWLEAIRRFAVDAVQRSSVVIACSALKAAYRALLSQGFPGRRCFWVHLNGDYDTIYKRLSARQGHFMPEQLLRSQFDAYEPPDDGLLLDVAEPPERLIQKIMDAMENQPAEMGLIGLGVMGRNLARNFGRNGMALALYNRHVPGKEERVAEQCVADYRELSGAAAFEDLPAFVASLALPRKIFLMIEAGPAVDQVLDALLPLLSPGDVVIDGGNSHYNDTLRRAERLNTAGIHYLGAGVSGGEEGALNGPAIMPGGSAEGYRLVEPYLHAAAAKDAAGKPCCAYIGPDGAGHFVKMVHNGIEYAEMQLLSEVYTFLRWELRLDIEAVAAELQNWQQTELQSYLLGITLDILRYRENGAPLIDQILDKAGNKGTGSWTTVAACELGVPASVIAAALFARYQSAHKEERNALNGQYNMPGARLGLRHAAIKNAYAFSRIINHHQGFHLIREASVQYGWNIDAAELARIWTNGCIIRSQLMQQISEWVGNAPSLMAHPEVAEQLHTYYPAMRNVLSALCLSKHSYPCLMAALAGFNGATEAQSGANLIQAQRDYFGAHTYERVDNPGGGKYHTHWTKKL
ncbi:MAG: NADP-dependent phosphogluconate dehydrogenase [Saprospiraceae bacterium]|nr:NADP-dependent phosphogluconate dehydrogenase [Saprospiraceae bacterium]